MRGRWAMSRFRWLSERTTTDQWLVSQITPAYNFTPFRDCARHGEAGTNSNLESW
jgi:hypothetical protein